MQIHLSKPGGHREGPFTVDEINRDLAAKKYSDSDYWAWYEGLGSWIPLHSVPGVKAPSAMANGPSGVFAQSQQPYGSTESQSESVAQEQETALAVMPEEELQRSPGATETEGSEPAEERSFERSFSPATDEQALFVPQDEFVSREEGRYSEEATTEARDTQSAGGDLPLRISEPASAEAEKQSTVAEAKPSEAKANEGNTAGESLASEQTEAGPSEPAEQEEMGAAKAEMAAAPRESKVHSGLPAEALEHVFVFTTGEGPSVRQSGVVAMMMLEMIGENPDDLRQRVPRDVFGKCNVGERIREEGKVPGSAWRAMAALRPELVERAKAGEYRTCVRTFATEADDVVAIFLFYNKAQLTRTASAK